MGFSFDFSLGNDANMFQEVYVIPFFLTSFFFNKKYSFRS